MGVLADLDRSPVHCSQGSVGSALPEDPAVLSTNAATAEAPPCRKAAADPTMKVFSSGI